MIHQASDKRQLGKSGNGKSYLVETKIISIPSFEKAHRKSRSLSMTNWKVKAQSIIGRKSRSSFKIESSCRSKKVSIRITKTAQFEMGETKMSWLSKTGSARKMMKIVTDASFMKTSGMSNEQLNDFALVSKIRK